ncbi:MAG: hypothetical protein HYR62_01280 [Actinobacteria bacterium]|nr:hypothetical protein [Actinomycetota bacterium]MBI3688808.1 hypothetical protein [Actinomycetota bacterium]
MRFPQVPARPGWLHGARGPIAVAAAVAATALLATALPAAGAANASGEDTSDTADLHAPRHPVSVEVFAPGNRDNAGDEGAGWFVDLAVSYPGSPAAAGFTARQLTGPAGHNNIPPSPGTFSPGKDDRLPGLVVLTSTTTAARTGFSGPGTNLANLFNVTGITDRSATSTEIWDTWIVGADIAGRDVDTVLTVAVVDDLNHDGIYNDAPSVVADLNGDGVVDAKDLRALGVASTIETVHFHINGAPIA